MWLLLSKFIFVLFCSALSHLQPAFFFMRKKNSVKLFSFERKKVGIGEWCWVDGLQKPHIFSLVGVLHTSLRSFLMSFGA